MTEQQAQEIYARFFVAFPQFRSWLEKQPDSADTMALWCQIITRVDHDVADAVVESMIDGRVEIPDSYNRDRLPQIIKAECERITDERRERAHDREQNERISQQAAHGGRGVGAAMAVLINQARALGDRQKRGKIGQTDHDAQIMQLRTRAANLRGTEDDPRFDCPICRDTGFVEIWHPDITQKARAKGIESITRPYRTCNAACVCQHGKSAREGSGRWSALRAYDETRMCRVIAPSETDLPALQTWIEESVKVENHSNYHQEFEEWSR